MQSLNAEGGETSGQNRYATQERSMTQLAEQETKYEAGDEDEQRSRMSERMSARDVDEEVWHVERMSFIDTHTLHIRTFEIPDPLLLLRKQSFVFTLPYYR